MGIPSKLKGFCANGSDFFWVFDCVEQVSHYKRDKQNESTDGQHSDPLCPPGGVRSTRQR
jgi:hypothetical protein